MAAITKYFVGGELEAFYQGSDAGTTWATDAGTYDGNFSRGAVKLTSGGLAYINMPLTSPQLTCWISFQHYCIPSWVAGGGSSTTLFNFVNANLTPIYRLQIIDVSTPTQPVIQLQYWNGSSWLSATGSSSSIVAPTNQLHKWDFFIHSDSSSGVLKAYMDGIPFANFSGNTQFVSPAPVAAVHMQQFVDVGTGTIYVSEGQILDVSTLGRRLATLGEVSNGTNSQWTGSVTDINEVGTFNDSNFIQTGTANQVSTFVNSTLSSVAQQYVVSGLVVAGRILIGAVGPQNLKGAVVVSGTTYFSSANVANLLTSFGYTWADFPVNPATGLDWTVGQIDAPIETGWQSLA
jgi:hypothetical protein